MNLSINKSVVSSRRKAAILLMYLDSKMPGLSKELFSKMGESRSKTLLHEINQLGKVEKSEIVHVIDEFYELAITQNSVIGGKNVTDKLLKDSFGIEDPDDFFSSTTGLFDYVNLMTDKVLLDYLKKENLQVAALILSLIPDDRSAKLLSEFSVEKTAQISKKMLSLNVPSYQMLWKFHRELEGQLLGDDGDKIEESQQIFKLSRVLEMMVSDTRKTVVDMISSQDKTSAEKIKQLIFSFEDLIFMSNKDLGIMLVEVDPLRSLAIAMQGISEELKTKILDSMSQRIKPRLEEEVSNTLDVSEEEIQTEQGNIIQLCRQLEKEEKIESLASIIKQKQEAGNYSQQSTESNSTESNTSTVTTEPNTSTGNKSANFEMKEEDTSNE